ncbi:uncharacterized protein LOC131621751 [Vicia villosa]|uniref:uncharacterized protein LOC131621751 n=1 Tax=Vicia villosa TaxID=3911 RepID=UPI00273B0A5C|nr:uncharacterized protein LOC131621751 [Vicia villosa]
MELCGDLQHSELIAYFDIAKISSQPYPEIQPSFVEKNKDEISKCWTVMNNQGVHHDIIYNQIEIHPLVISGWPCMELYYNLPSDVVMTVGYYGNNNFGILSFKEVVTPEDLPRFHSRCLFKRDIFFFDMDFFPFSVDRPKLKLHEDFALFLGDYGYEFIVLCGDNGKNKTMSPLNLSDPRRTKLGYGWDNFCKSNNFKCGDRIRFRLEVTSVAKICYVYSLPQV